VQINTATEPIFNVWVSQAVADPTAWRMALATANIRLIILKTENPFLIAEDRDTLQLYTECLGQVHKRLQDPRDCTSEGLITAVLGFACQDVSFPIVKLASHILDTLATGGKVEDSYGRSSENDRTSGWDEGIEWLSQPVATIHPTLVSVSQ
jgi:hypothetical protein